MRAPHLPNRLLIGQHLWSMPFDLQPTLRGKLIELRPLKPEDFNELLRAGSDPLIWEQHPESDRYKKEVFQLYFDSALESRGGFAVTDRKTGKIIGSTRYCNLKPQESEVEIGYTFLERAYWGGEYNGEMKRLMLDHAFKFVERVVFVVGASNWRSQKALEKIGARMWKSADSKARDGSPRPIVIFQITRKQSSKAKAR